MGPSYVLEYPDSMMLRTIDLQTIDLLDRPPPPSLLLPVLPLLPKIISILLTASPAPYLLGVRPQSYDTVPHPHLNYVCTSFNFSFYVSRLVPVLSLLVVHRVCYTFASA